MLGSGFLDRGRHWRRGEYSMTLLDPRPDVVAPPATPPAVTTKPCRCGHGRTAHEHYRRGSDCALCGCDRYRRRRLIG